MAEKFVLSFVDKLALLEKTAGAEVPYRIMQPGPVSPHDFGEMTRTARKIAAFAGLSRFTFLICPLKQKQGVAGNIDLSTKGSDVFIEVDSTALGFPEIVIATLCHEISHKWLHVKGISSPIEMDNEILTDITTVFLGLGKLMLNGCRAQRIRTEQAADGTRTITESRTCGYLKLDQLAFVYRLVCAMRNVPESEYMAGLNLDAQSAIYTCDRSFGEYYNPRFHQPDSHATALKDFRGHSVARQRQLADLNKHLDYILRSFCHTVQNSIADGHKTLQTLCQTARRSRTRATPTQLYASCALLKSSMSSNE